jgi:LDH2 family malate/lactate/ureidoglycolate dehydrogenase
MPASYAAHRAQLKAILLGWGMPEANAETTSEILAWSDLHGVDSHGISMLPAYDGLRRNGRAKMDAQPRIVRETAVSALVDGGGGLGHVPAKFAMAAAIRKAKAAGMAATVVKHSAHFGAAGYYTLMAVEQGLIGMACTSASGIQVAPTFGKQAKLGTDPWSFAAPSADGVPFCWTWRRPRSPPGACATRPTRGCRRRTAGCWTGTASRRTIRWWQGRRAGS